MIRYANYLILLLNFGASLVILRAVLRGGLAAAAGRNVRRARLNISEGVILALSLQTATALLKTIVVTSWQELGMFAAILALRTLVKQYFNWEQRQIRSRPFAADLHG